MKELIQKLPTDIILQIIPYTYNLQNKNLLNDIINYNKTKTILLELYHNFWIIEMQSQEEEDKYWLINDLIAYTNDYNATMNGYVDKFYNIFKRNFFLQKNEDIDKYFYNFNNKEVTSQINIILGLLTANEREDLITEFPIFSESVTIFLAPGETETAF
jgi:hypothetical protein